MQQQGKIYYKVQRYHIDLFTGWLCRDTIYNLIVAKSFFSQTLTKENHGFYSFIEYFPLAVKFNICQTKVTLPSQNKRLVNPHR